MKKSTSQLPQCSMFEHLHGTGKFDGAGQSWYGVNLYAVAGLPGLWRRVPRQGGPMSDPSEKRAGAVAAYWCGTVVALARDLAAEVELLEAGFGVGYTLNECRAAAGLPPIEALDALQPPQGDDLPQDVPATAPEAEVPAQSTPATGMGGAAGGGAGGAYVQTGSNGAELTSLFPGEVPVSRKRKAAIGA